MPVISSTTTSVPANGTIEVLAVSQFNIITKPTAIGIRASSAAVGILISYFLGGDTVINQGGVPATNRFPIKPDDDILATSASAGEKQFLEFRNTTVSAIVVQWVVELL